MEESTKERIKREALILFANRGYDGMTLNELAKRVGIKKASLYAHFDSKDDLFLAIYFDLATEFVALMKRLFVESAHLKPPDRLYYLFEQYIIYYYRRPEAEAFWNQILLFTPAELSDQYLPHWLQCDGFAREKIEQIISQGMQQGCIRQDDAKKMTFSFVAMRDGLLYWLKTFSELEKAHIREIWRDFWLGLQDVERRG